MKLILPLLLLSFMILNGCGRGDASEKGNKAANDSTQVAEADSASSENDEKKDGKKKNGKDEEDNPDLEYVPVEVNEAYLGEISQYLLLSATLKTEEQVTIYPETGGIVRQLLVDEGDRVEEGDVLLILDDEEKQLNRDEALVTFREQEAAFNRAIELRKQNLISGEEHDQAKFNQDRARLSYERSELELRRTKVIAPISGYIAERTVNRGNLVNMSSQLFSLVNPTDMIAEVHIPEAELPRITKNKKVDVDTDVYPELDFNAEIKRISPVVDASSGTFKVTVGIHDEKEILKPGMFVSVRIVTDVHRDVVLVPKESVIYENDLPYVFMVADSIALKIPLRAGYDDNKYIEARDLIKPGDKIVTIGQTGLKDSAKVKIIDMDEIRKKAREMAELNGEKLEQKRESASGS